MQAFKTAVCVLICGSIAGAFRPPQARADLLLPYDGSADASTVLRITNTTQQSQSQAILGQNDSAEIGAAGVYGLATGADNANAGVVGKSLSTNGAGVVGRAETAVGNNMGVLGLSTSAAGMGVLGHSTANVGVCGRQGADFFTPLAAAGVFGVSGSPNGIGVYGLARADSGVNYGVIGHALGRYSYAGYFRGRVHVTGNFTAANKMFRIDHPLDPANRYLNHNCVESPDMMNIYNGVAKLDSRGEARVVLPEWFESLNGQFRYQLTAIGAPAPNLHVAEEIADNRFRIAGGPAGMKVSWQVTGVRQDAWANAYRTPVEEDKPAGERGSFLHPELFGDAGASSVASAPAAVAELRDAPAAQNFSFEDPE